LHNLHKKGAEMNNEEFLLRCIKQCVLGIKLNIQDIKDFGEDYKIAGFDDGKICGLLHALGNIQASIRLYEARARGELPDELEFKD